MEFGSVPTPELNQIDFTLPCDPVENAVILSGARHPKDGPKVYLGCDKWGRKEWIGKIYPKGTKESEFLELYTKHYNSIELNATHYKIYSPAEIKKWADKAKGKNFLFCPKIPQTISHYSSFIRVEEETTAFLEGVLAFKDHLGPIFLQVSEKYNPSRKGPLFEYLRSLPTDLQFFVEVRHPSWFADLSAAEELFNTLCELKIGAVITDTAGRRDCAHMHLTLPKTFIRFVGNSLHPTDYTRIDDWVKRIGTWLDKGLEELYFFMHMHNEATSPELTVYLVDRLNAACGLRLDKPVFIQPTLF